MTIQVTGKNVDAGEAFKSYANGRISAAVGKYTGAEIAGHIRLEKERSLFRTGIVVRLKSGLMLEATGEGGDAYASADAAIEHLEKRLRRHKRRITNHHGGHTASARETLVPDFTVEVGEDDLLLHHFSLGSRASRTAFALPCRMALIYHNITPPEYFLGVHDQLVRQCFHGRRELLPYRSRCDLALGDSEFNRRELESLGFPRTAVLPVVPDFTHLEVPPDLRVKETARRTRGHEALHLPRAYALQGLDINGDGTYDDSELAELTRRYRNATDSDGYFTIAELPGETIQLGQPTDFRLDVKSGILSQSFVLPFSSPISPGPRELRFAIFDPSYFIAFEVEKADFLATGGGLPSTCRIRMLMDSDAGAPTPLPRQELPADFSPDLMEPFGTVSVACTAP